MLAYTSPILKDFYMRMWAVEEGWFSYYYFRYVVPHAMSVWYYYWDCCERHPVWPPPEELAPLRAQRPVYGYEEKKEEEEDGYVTANEDEFDDDEPGFSYVDPDEDDDWAAFGDDD